MIWEGYYERLKADLYYMISFLAYVFNFMVREDQMLVLLPNLQSQMW